jgi:tetratricopeptide (TPR) repeat protein
MARSSPKRRSGLRIVGRRGPSDVRRCLQRYARWLREYVNFPVRVPVYLSPRKELKLSDGQSASASILTPFDRRQEPYIRIAAGDYAELLRERGRDRALAAYLGSLSHEVVHYRQWIERKPLTERGVIAKASAMVDDYATCVDRPLETRAKDNASIGTWLNLVQVHINQGRWAKAKRLLRAELAGEPDNHLLLNYLAYCELEHRCYAPALRAVRRAHALEPRCPSVLIIYARIAFANGKPGLALELCERILARSPRSLASGACGEGLAAARKLKADARALAKRCQTALR